MTQILYVQIYQHVFISTKTHVSELKNGSVNYNFNNI